MSYRNSTVPDWSLSEVDGYFANRTPSISSERSDRSQNSGHAGVITASQQKFVTISRNVKAEEIKIKFARLLQPLGIAVGMQAVFVLTLSVFLPKSYWKKEAAGFYYYLGITYIYNVVRTLIDCMFSIYPILLVMLSYVMMFVISTCVSTSDYQSETLYERFRRYFSLRFISKPVCFGMMSLIHGNMFLRMFDASFNVMISTPPNQSKEFVEIYFRPDLLTVRIALFCGGIIFFVRNFLFGGFHLSFSTVRSKSMIHFVMDTVNPAHIVRESLCLGFVSWLLCLILGMYIFTPFGIYFGIKLYSATVLDRLVQFADFSFLFHLFLWIFMSQATLFCYSAMVNARLSEIINLPIEQPSNNNQCLILSEGMKCGSKYIRFLSFYEFSFKTDEGHPDSMIFFNLTHPGNHPLNWKGVFNATCALITDTTEKIIQFLKTANIPASTLQSNVQPYVLNRLREVGNNQHVPNGHDAAAQNRRENVRDLRAPMVQPVPDVPPNAVVGIEHIEELPMALWMDMKKFLCTFFSWQNMNNLIFFGQLDKKIPECQLANILSERKLLTWGIGGCLKLICLGLNVDRRGIVHQDIEAFLTKLLEIFDCVSALDVYINHNLDKEQGINRKSFLILKNTVSEIIAAITFVVSKLHIELQDCYNILDIPRDCQERLAEIYSTYESANVND